VQKKEKIHKKKNIGIILVIVCILLVIGSNLISKKEVEKTPLEELDIKKTKETTNVLTHAEEEVLLNPGKGFVIRDALTSNYDDIISVGYFRTNWDNIEPIEGQYNWAYLDEKIDFYSQKGKKFAFGIACASSSSTKQYLTPKWVFDAGAQYYTAKINENLTQIIPVWTDEIFLEKLNNFITALAERYDGNPNIAYIDIRSYGNWGEQHLGVIGGTYLTSNQLMDLYIKPFKQAFKKTLLVNPWGDKRYNDVYEWAIQNGITLRRDGIFQYSNGTECMMAYGKLPTIFEYTHGYGWMKENGYWSQENLLQYVQNGKPSYLEFDPNMYKENKDFCRMLANKIGYYFRFKGAEYKNSITTKEQNKIKLNFINEGVAPLYEPCTVYIGLLDENYHLIKKYKTDINPHTWMPNEDVQENLEIQLDGVEDGTYIISLGLFLNEEDEQPTYLLGNTGKTNEGWYVFGEINITNPKEEYTIQLSNENTLINTKNGYKVKVQAINLRENDNYVLKIYNNQKLIQTYDMQANNNQWYKEVTLAFENGNQFICMQVEKNGEIVCERSKSLFVCNFETEYQAISNVATEKYTEFQNKFATEIAQIPVFSERINNMKNYMVQVGAMQQTIMETSSIEAMELHYDLGNKLLQAYQNGTLKVEYVKLSSMLDMLDDIGNSYEDLVTVTAKTRNPNLDGTKKIIDDTESIIKNNEDLEMVYPSKILDFSKDYYEKAEYIHGLEEENPIKTGLIMSKSLHSKLLANWANQFANLYMDTYIANNPVSIHYSETEWTNQDVKASLETNANIEMKEGEREHTFEENGTYVFAYSIRGREFTIEATVNNIDKKLPEIKDVIEGKVYTETVIPRVIDINLQSIELYANDERVDGYTLNAPIEEEGIYTLRAIDKAGNISEVNFQILKITTEGYQIEQETIKNIQPNTSMEAFEKELGFRVKYEIQRNGQTLAKTETIATGDTLITENKDTYTLIVAGDINKDGIVNIKDVVKMRIYLLERNNLDAVELLAADANVDAKPLNIKDLVRMRIMVLNKK